MRIFFDMDGVIVDLMTGWLEWYNKKYNDSLVMDGVNAWDITKYVKCGEAVLEYLHLPGSFYNASPYPGAIEALEKICLDGRYEVFLATVPVADSIYCIDEKMGWADLYLPFIGAENTVILPDKSLLRGDFLVDDNCDNLSGFQGVRILFDRPWNRDEWREIAMPFFTVFRWSDIEEFFLPCGRPWNLTRV